MEADFDDDWDDAPWADPQIRVAYELALGRLILAHNEVDHRLAKALQRVALRVAPDGSLNKFATGTFAQRLLNLELLQKVSKDLGVVLVDVALLRKLNALRNDVAHGHFDQNPFDGSYTLIGDGRGTGRKPFQYSEQELEEAREGLDSIAKTLLAYEAFGDFPRKRQLPPAAMLVDPQP